MGQNEMRRQHLRGCRPCDDPSWLLAAGPGLRRRLHSPFLRIPRSSRSTNSKLTAAGCWLASGRRKGKGCCPRSGTARRRPSRPFDDRLVHRSKLPTSLRGTISRDSSAGEGSAGWVALGTINFLLEADPQTGARRMTRVVEHHRCGMVRASAPSLRVDGASKVRPPARDADNILCRRLNNQGARISALAREGAFGADDQWCVQVRGATRRRRPELGRPARTRPTAAGVDHAQTVEHSIS